MQLFLLCVFAAVAVAPLLWAVRHPQHFLEFPVVTGAVWAAYVLPQAIGIYRDPRFLPPALFRDGFAPTMLMCSLCACMGYAGYAIAGRGRRPATPISVRRLFVAGAVCGVLALVAILKLTALSGGLVRYFSVTGGYALDWHGAPVRYGFLALILIYPALLLLYLSCAIRPTATRIAISLLFTMWPLALIIFMGRRSHVMYLAFMIATALHFGRGWHPSRRQLLAAVWVLMAVVFVLPAYRNYSEIGANHGELANVHVTGEIDNVVSGQDRKEFNNTIGLVGIANHFGIYSYGTYYYNVWIRRMVPRQLVGQEVKSSLEIHTAGAERYNELSNAVFGWRTTRYQSVSSAGSLFLDFWFFGSLVYLFFGIITRRLYDHATGGSVTAQIVYSFLIMLLPFTIATGFGKFPRRVLATFVLLTPILVYARQSRARRLTGTISPKPRQPTGRRSAR